MTSLEGLRVLDLSRVLAGPWCTQLLADLGAEVIKIEQPGRGDDTRRWGPPYLGGTDAQDSSPAAYYLATNRGKRSVAIDFSRPEGARLVASLAGHSDILVENFRPGTLARYGLDAARLGTRYPKLIYCSISGFGQDGPYAERPGYDLLIQAMGGLMSLTGAADGEPVKVGVAVADILTGLYASSAILAALHQRQRSGRGQYLDLSLFDVQVATLANQAMNYLVGGAVPERMGSAHPNIVPYQSFPTADDHIVLAVGNDEQFRRLAELLGRKELAADPRYQTNAARVHHRDLLVPTLTEALATRPAREWLSACAKAGIPAGPVNSLEQVFADPQIRSRGLVDEVSHPALGRLPRIGAPLRINGSPVVNPLPPPLLGEHTATVLHDWLGLGAETIEALCANGTVAEARR